MASNFHLYGRPNVKVRSIGIWASNLTYSDLVIALGAAHHWPLGGFGTAPDFNYDEIIINDPACTNHWPLDSLDEIIYQDYSIKVVTDGAVNHWPLDEIE